MASLIDRRKMMMNIAGTKPPFQIVTSLIVPTGAYVDSGIRADYYLNLTLEGLHCMGGAFNGFGSLTTINGTQRYHMDSPEALYIGNGGNAIRIYNFFRSNLSIVRPYDNYYNIDGVEGSLNIGFFDCYMNMILFARGREGSSQMEFASWNLDDRIYLQRGAEERDYRPAICKEAVENVRGVVVPAGTAGLWNIIDNTFWTSDSATDFQYIL